MIIETSQPALVSVNKNVVVKQLQINFHKLELLMSEQRLKKIKKEQHSVVFFRLMEIEAEIYSIRVQIDQLIDVYFEIIEEKVFD